jgi:hypothetical protein
VTTTIEIHTLAPDDGGDVVERLEVAPASVRTRARLMSLRTEAESRDPKHYSLPLIHAALAAQSEIEMRDGADVIQQLLDEERAAEAPPPNRRATKGA